MMKIRRKYDVEFKKDAVKLSSCASSKPIKDVAADLGISEPQLYRWRQRYTAEGDKTRFATMEEENRALRLELAEIKMERDMLKKRRPTSPNSKNEIPLYIRAIGLYGVEVGKILKSVTQRI